MNITQWRNCTNPLEMIDLLVLNRRDIIDLLYPYVSDLLDRDELDGTDLELAHTALAQVLGWQLGYVSALDVHSTNRKLLDRQMELLEHDIGSLAAIALGAVSTLCGVCTAKDGALTRYETKLLLELHLGRIAEEEFFNAFPPPQTSLEEEVVSTLQWLADFSLETSSIDALRDSHPDKSDSEVRQIARTTARTGVRLALCIQIRYRYAYPGTSH